MWVYSLPYLAAGAALLLARPTAADQQQNGVFAHYMVGIIDEDHVHQDVDDAVDMGLDGFALNIGNPSAQFSRTLFNNMFDYTRDNHPNFKLFISMDMWSSDNVSHFDSFLTDFLGHEAYYKGPNGYPLVSTYGNGGFSEDVWQDWRNTWENNIYFMPDFTDLVGQGNATTAWWKEWGGLVNGLFGWESAWPERGLSTTMDFAADETQIAGTNSQNKTYMIGMSMVQYKNSYGANIYRAGEENLSWRIHNILNMPSPPDFVQLLTWNDGPESHYMGNIWPEANNDTDPNRYATQNTAPHNAIRPVLTSFITAFKDRLGPSDMLPPSNNTTVGALWFKPILASTKCKNENSGELPDEKPDGYAVAADVSAWAVVLAANKNGHKLRGFSAGDQIGEADLVSGFNFGNFSAMHEGQQCMEVRDADNHLVAVARGGSNVTADCPDGIYNLNPQILNLDEDVSGGGCANGGDDDADNGKKDSRAFRVVALDRFWLASALLTSLACIKALW